LKEGIKLARRTVTKYREEVHIQPARFRKTVYDKKPDSTRSDGDLSGETAPDGERSVDEDSAGDEPVIAPRSDEPREHWASRTGP